MLRKAHSHYEILGIDANATPYEIRHAYNEMHQLYHDDSLASYSFFTKEERRDILSEIDKAYSILIDEKSRTLYDSSLAVSGPLKNDLPPDENRKSPMPIFDIDRTVSSSSPVLKTMEVIRGKALSSPSIQNILSKETISGNDLANIRLELALTIEVAAGITKIRPEYLTAIEEDRYNDLPSRQLLKGFLKSYLQCMGLNPDSVTERYLKKVEDNER
jgi:curved DNA-binding protein CbpA